MYSYFHSCTHVSAVFYIKKLIHFVFQIEVQYVSFIESHKPFLMSKVDCLGLCFNCVSLHLRNWKMRWFVLRDNKLMYYDNDSEEKLKGTIDIRAAKWDFLRSFRASKQKHNPLFTLSPLSEQQLRLSDVCTYVCFFPGRLWIIMKRRTLWTLWQTREPIRCLLSRQRMQGGGRRKTATGYYLCLNRVWYTSNSCLSAQWVV